MGAWLDLLDPFPQRGFGNFNHLLYGWRAFTANDHGESGIGVIEVILILLVLVGLVLIFKEQIISLARTIFSNITGQVNKV